MAIDPTPFYENLNKANGEAPAASLSVIFPPDWHCVAVPERKWVVDKLLPLDNVTMLSGDGGLGKSQLALQLLINAAVSRHWLGYPTLAYKTLGV